MKKVFLGAVRRNSSEHDISKAVRETVESATDFAWLSKRDSVFIKPALNSGAKYPATTSPAGVKAMVALLKEKGAGRVVVGDMAGIEHLKLEPNKVKGSSRSLMEKCGMAKAALAAGAELHFFEEAGWNGFYEDYPAGVSHWSKGIMMPQILKEMDHIILMPRCGRHALAGSTLGLKAVVGYWRTDTRLEYHKDCKTFHEKTAEANTVTTLLNKQRLVVSLATKVLSTFGPDRGYVSEPDPGLITVSDSVTANDMVLLAWLLMARSVTPAWNLIWINDPHKSGLVVNLANRWIVSMLGSYTDAIGADSLINNDIGTIWEDRTLNCAYEVLGGKPEIEFEFVNDVIPEGIRKRLVEMTNFAS